MSPCEKWTLHPLFQSDGPWRQFYFFLHRIFCPCYRRFWRVVERLVAFEHILPHRVVYPDYKVHEVQERIRGAILKRYSGA